MILKTTTNRPCDCCSKGGTVRWLPGPALTGYWLCRECWRSEMKYRKGRNARLRDKSRFEICAFEKGTSHE